MPIIRCKLTGSRQFLATFLWISICIISGLSSCSSTHKKGKKQGTDITVPTGWFISLYNSSVSCKKANEEKKGYSIPMAKDVSISIMYIEDAARALVMLGNAPKEQIKTVNYFINGIKHPYPTVEEMRDYVMSNISEAELDYDVNEIWSELFRSAGNPWDDSSAVKEWGWDPKYDTYEKFFNAYVKDYKANK